MFTAWYPAAFSRIAVGNWFSPTRKTHGSLSNGRQSGAQRTDSDLKRRMDQAVGTFQANLASTRTGRASVHMLDQVKVDYYGTPTPISQMAQVSAPEPQMILISPWDPQS